MGEQVLQMETVDQIAVVTLNRPEAMNSFSFELLNALKDAVWELRFQKDVRAVIITGAGEKAFSAGADLKERAGMSQEEVRKFIYTIRNLFTEIEGLDRKSTRLNSSHYS